MKRFLFLMILPVIALTLGSCSDDDDVMDTHLIKGCWQLVTPDAPDNGCIYSFATQSENTWSWGVLTTYYLTADGSTVHDKVYDWHVSDPNNYDIVYLDLTLRGELDTDGDAWQRTSTYIIETLTPSEMILRADATELHFARIQN